MLRMIFMITASSALAFTSYASDIPFKNGGFDSPFDKVRSPNVQHSPWKVQDYETGYNPNTIYNYGGLVTREYDANTNNWYAKIYSHHAEESKCKNYGINCHRAELFYSPDRYDTHPDYLNIDGQRTQITFRFKVDRIWNKGCRVKAPNSPSICYSTLMQYGPPSNAAYPVAPMMSFVIARYPQANERPAISLQHKVHCAKPSNKIHYSGICDNKGNSIASWSADTIIPIEVGRWYVAYSHVLWSEQNGEFSAAIKPEGGTWTHFSKDGQLFHHLPTRAANGKHNFKAGIYGHGIDTSDEELVMSFDDFKFIN
ncbi:hypothetical protein [Pseudoalteromonas obscura]|uniref:Uncharacterized protein n=1 Tax=Pseudoalteromonas obscura TaxID=3048491 RepID=A0ABT7EFX8_9GAMM|nr:hypothetical protein [Pseudoalteromonas sp. P94(2023)]MDK2593462.1 hypothetical protein [Pseudoalteromonas sp. P94(2023)]